MRTGSVLILAAVLIAGLASIAHAQQNTPIESSSGSARNASYRWW